MRTVIACIAILALAPPAAAQATKNMPGMSHGTAKTGRGVGVITALDLKAGKVTIKHGPIPAVGWPAMTMTFRAAPALLGTVRAGQTVAFAVRARGMDAEVTAMKRR
jgi:Cu(I)/Ag(I) efflux system protein CusF